MSIWECHLYHNLLHAFTRSKFIFNSNLLHFIWRTLFCAYHLLYGTSTLSLPSSKDGQSCSGTYKSGPDMAPDFPLEAAIFFASVALSHTSSIHWSSPELSSTSPSHCSSDWFKVRLIDPASSNSLLFTITTIPALMSTFQPWPPTSSDSLPRRRAPHFFSSLLSSPERYIHHHHERRHIDIAFFSALQPRLNEVAFPSSSLRTIIAWAPFFVSSVIIFMDFRRHFYHCRKLYSFTAFIHVYLIHDHLNSVQYRRSSFMWFSFWIIYLLAWLHFVSVVSANQYPIK